MSEDVKSAANSYKEDFTTSGDPLVKLVGRIGSVAGTVGGSAANRMRDRWKGQRSPTSRSIRVIRDRQMSVGARG